ncbi:hypothetical protein AB0395_27420 [Streptosporangium sp. NPDC051023]|uniref:hypothetical protein n=1 Tax=Streptosporangium sp. NPDC051023 TaxID=3155410 RepID=UPI00344BEFA1
MSWTRYDDLFTERPDWDGVSYPARWHYLAMVQACSRQRRWDGRMPLTRARRASDVDDPDGCLAELAGAGWVRPEGDVVILPLIAEHIPAPSIRDNAEKSKIRMRKSRAHRNGDHSLCDPDRCEKAASLRTVTPPVTRNTGTGRDGTGQDLSEARANSTPADDVTDDPWPPVAQIKP